MFAFIKSFFAVAAAATATAAEYSVMKITLYATDDRKVVSGSSVADYRHSVVSASHYTDFDKAVSAARKSSANQPLWLATTAVVVDGVIVVAYHDGAIVAGQGYYPTR